MKHKGNTPAIYANTRTAYLVQPGQTVPSRHARFIVGHSDLTCIAIAYDKSTFGERDGSRSVSTRYPMYAVEVLARVVNRRIEPVTEAEFHTLLHSLGWPSKTLGWRNHYNVGQDPVVDGLVERGLMELMNTPAWAGRTYRVTRRGQIVAGVPEEESL